MRHFLVFLLTLNITSCQSAPKASPEVKGAAVSKSEPLAAPPFTKYPNGLLSDHYGILIESDLKHFYDNVTLHDRLNPDSPYSHWVCATNPNFKLRPLGSDIPNKPNYESRIKILSEWGLNIYSQRRGVVYRRGQFNKRQFKKISQGQSHFCVAGSLVEIDKATTPHTYYWIWDLVKTPKGYLDFFGWTGE